MILIQNAFAVFLNWLRGHDGLFAIRHDWPECCRDNDEARRICHQIRQEHSLRGL